MEAKIPHLRLFAFRGVVERFLLCRWPEFVECFHGKMKDADMSGSPRLCSTLVAASSGLGIGPHQKRRRLNDEIAECNKAVKGLSTTVGELGATVGVAE